MSPVGRPPKSPTHDSETTVTLRMAAETKRRLVDIARVEKTSMRAIVERLVASWDKFQELKDALEGDRGPKPR